MDLQKQAVLLFVHGWATDKWVWKHQLKAFNNGIKFHNITLPGHGNSKKWGEPTLTPHARALLTHHSFSTAERSSYVGIGWSLGAQLLLASAIEMGKKFHALVLIGATPCFVKKKNFPWAQPRIVVKKMIKDMRTMPEKTLKRFYRLNFTEDELKTYNALSFLNRYEQTRPKFMFDEITSGLEAILNTDLRDRLSSLSIPILFIHGEMDKICPVGAAYYLANKIKKARLNIFKKSGHAPFITEAEKFNKVLLDFLESL